MKKKNRLSRLKKFWKFGFEEFNTEHFDISNDGELVVREGNFQYNIYDIVKKYGTPTEIVFPTMIENRVRDLIDTFNAYIKVLGYKGKFFYHYAMKVNQNREIVLLAVAEGANLEVSSANELFFGQKNAGTAEVQRQNPRHLQRSENGALYGADRGAARQGAGGHPDY